MTIYDLPPVWDARKFAIRYGLNSLADEFYVNAEGKLVVRKDIADDPPIFEQPDPPPAAKPSIDEIVARIEALEAKVNIVPVIDAKP